MIQILVAYMKFLIYLGFNNLKLNLLAEENPRQL